MCALQDALCLSRAKLERYPYTQVARYPRGHYNVFTPDTIRQIIADHGGLEAIDLRRQKKIASTTKRRENAAKRFHTRTADLDAALRALGLERRYDSRLCDDFIAGRCDRSASQVAETMAEILSRVLPGIPGRGGEGGGGRRGGGGAHRRAQQGDWASRVWPRR
jgi:hypothetical protein